MKMANDPDFSNTIKDILAKRAGQTCSNPECRRPTSGAHTDEDKAINLGEAAHIRAARQGQARYDPGMTDVERSHISNGIWLCRTCAAEIDRDPQKYTVEVLNNWKKEHEKRITSGKPLAATRDTDETFIKKYDEISKLMNVAFEAACLFSGDFQFTGADILAEKQKSASQSKYEFESYFTNHRHLFSLAARKLLEKFNMEIGKLIRYTVNFSSTRDVQWVEKSEDLRPKIYELIDEIIEEFRRDLGR